MLYIRDFIVKFYQYPSGLLGFFFTASFSVAVFINVIVTFLQKKALRNLSDPWKATENLDTIQINDVSTYFSVKKCTVIVVFRCANRRISEISEIPVRFEFLKCVSFSHF